MTTRTVLTAPSLLAVACLVDVAVADDGGSIGGDSTTPSVASASDGAAADTHATGVDGTGPASGSSSDGAPKFDLAAANDVSIPSDLCHVDDGLSGPGACQTHAPPDSFAPEVQWSWPADLGGSDYMRPRSYVTPLVANLTDDDGNGSIDLCDTPDVVLVTHAFADSGDDIGRLVILDGATGSEHLSIAGIDSTVIPALGDIDGDGQIEIVAGLHDESMAPPDPLIPTSTTRLGAFEADGTAIWASSVEFLRGQGLAIALADIDHDGDVEIVADGTVLDHGGNLVWSTPEPEDWCPPGVFSINGVCKSTATVVADLDGDDDMEIIRGKTAYRADGSEYWNHPELTHGFAQVANLDDDPMPEVVVVTQLGISLLEHDGSITVLDARPTGDEPGNSLTAWFRPASIHDFDGDGAAEIAVSSKEHYSVLESDLTVKWTSVVEDLSGLASGTAFDFLGDGQADAIYADETNLWVFDEDGSPLLDVPRASPTIIEYPVVADIDNDGAAEILVVSWPPYGSSAPALQAIRDVDERWVQARRIWNQHTYHVTNVREDGAIPQFEPRSWETVNTYRTNAQIEGSKICIPEPAG